MDGKTPGMTMKLPIVLITAMVMLVVLQSHTTQAFPIYAQFIPNGGNVPNPCKANTMWVGVGHLNPYGGGPINPFGEDFAQAGHQWTAELCQKDSDGDGLSNGVELGDPNCTWAVGQTPSSTTGITHPGINNDAPGCD